MDYEGDGFIKNDDFRNALMSLPQPPSDEVAQQLIQSMDKKGLGKVNYEEFIQFYVSEMDEEEKALATQESVSNDNNDDANNNTGKIMHWKVMIPYHVHIVKILNLNLLVIVLQHMGIQNASKLLLQMG